MPRRHWGDARVQQILRRLRITKLVEPGDRAIAIGATVPRLKKMAPDDGKSWGQYFVSCGSHNMQL